MKIVDGALMSSPEYVARLSASWALRSVYQRRACARLWMRQRPALYGKRTA